MSTPARAAVRHRLLTSLLVAANLAVWLVPGSAQQGPELFSLSRDNGAALFKIDPESGASLGTVVTTLPSRSLVGGRGLAASPVTQQLFAVLAYRENGGTPRLLATIDPVSGMAVEITASRLGQTAALAFDNPGTLYGGQAANAGEGFANKLYIFDTVTGERTEFMPFANSEAGLALALNPLDGHIYHLSGSLVFGTDLTAPVFEKIDPATKTRIEIPVSGDDMGHVRAMTFSPDGNFLVVGTLDPFGPSQTSGLFFRLTPAGVATELGPMDHRSKGLAFIPPVAAPENPPVPLTAFAVSDLGSGMDGEVAVVGELDGAGQVSIKDAGTTELVNRIDFSANLSPVDAQGVADLNANNADDIALLVRQAQDVVPRVEVRDSLTGNRIKNVGFNKQHEPVALAVLPDQNGNQTEEVAVLARQLSQNDRPRLLIRDLTTKAKVNNISLPKIFAPLDVAITSDLNGNGSHDAMVLVERKVDGKGFVLVWDTGGAGKIVNVQMPKQHAPVAHVALTGPGGVAAVAVLAVRSADSRGRLFVYDALTAAKLWAATLGDGREPLHLAVFATASGATRLAVLQQRTADQRPVVTLYNADTAALVTNLVYQAGTPLALTVFPDVSTDGNGEPELGVLYASELRLRDSVSKNLVSIISLP